MTDLKRYFIRSVDSKGTVTEPSPSGNVVFYADVEALVAERDALRDKLEAARNRVEDDSHGIDSTLRRNAVLQRALVLATQGDFVGYITEAERELGYQ
jgi:hypothetical protein